MDALQIEREGGVVTLTLNRPERKNALTEDLAGALAAELRALATDADARVVVLTGAGGEFCSGADLAEPSSEPKPALVAMRRVHETAVALHRLPKPTIALVDGVAAGAGCSLALGCDLVVATERARFCEIFSRRGLSPDYGSSWLLPRLVGLHRAKELAFLADLVPAADAMAMGLVNRVLPVDEATALAAEWARRLAAGPPLALSMTKALLNASHGRSLDEALEQEAQAQAVNFASKDTLEAITAFLEKREPRFTGW